MMHGQKNIKIVHNMFEGNYTKQNKKLTE